MPSLLSELFISWMLPERLLRVLISIKSAISSDGEILIEPFKFTNDYDGFYLLLSKLAPLDQNSIIIGLESTAHYGDSLVRFLISKDFKVCVLNPIQTSSMRKIMYARLRLIKSTRLLLLKPL